MSIPSSLSQGPSHQPAGLSCRQTVVRTLNLKLSLAWRSSPFDNKAVSPKNQAEQSLIHEPAPPSWGPLARWARIHGHSPSSVSGPFSCRPGTEIGKQQEGSSRSLISPCPGGVHILVEKKGEADVASQNAGLREEGKYGVPNKLLKLSK